MLFSRGVNKSTKRVWFRVMYVTAIIMYSVFLTTVHCFENSKKQKFISSKFRKQEKFVTSKFPKNSHHFAAFASKYRIERREISPTYRRKFARTIHKIRQNSLSLLLHSTVPLVLSLSKEKGIKLVMIKNSETKNSVAKQYARILSFQIISTTNLFLLLLS